MKYDALINETIKKNQLVKINNELYLSNYQIEVLKKYQIPFEGCQSINEIIFYIEEILNEDNNDLEDLENVSISLTEQDYYQNYKK